MLKKSHAAELVQTREFFQIDSVPNSKVIEKLTELARLEYNMVEQSLNKLLQDVFGTAALPTTDSDLARLL